MLIGLGVACVWDWMSSIHILDLGALLSYRTHTSFSLKNGLSWLEEGKKKTNKEMKQHSNVCDVQIIHISILSIPTMQRRKRERIHRKRQYKMIKSWIYKAKLCSPTLELKSQKTNGMNKQKLCKITFLALTKSPINFSRDIRV